MAKSVLQDAFMREFAATFSAAASHIESKLHECSDKEEIASFVKEELRGLYHGIFVIFDGGTALADKGLIQIVDEHRVAFDRYLHELSFDYWPEGE